MYINYIINQKIPNKIKSHHFFYVNYIKSVGTNVLLLKTIQSTKLNYCLVSFCNILIKLFHLCNNSNNGGWRTVYENITAFISFATHLLRCRLVALVDPRPGEHSITSREINFNDGVLVCNILYYYIYD